MNESRSSKAPLILAVVAIAAIGGIFALTTRNSGTAKKSATVTYSTEIAQKGSGVVSRLNSETLGFVHIDPAQLETLYNELEKFMARVRGLSLIKKMGLPQNSLTKPDIASSVRLSLEANPAGRSQQEIDEIVSLVSTFEKNMKGFTFMVSRKSFNIPVEGGLSVPAMGIMMQFDNENNASQVLNLFQQKINSGAVSKPGDSVQFKTTENAISVTATLPDGKSTDVGSLSKEGDSLWFLSGTTTPEIFTGGSALTGTNNWKQLAGHSMLKDSFIVSYFEPEAVISTLDQIGFFTGITRLAGDPAAGKEIEQARLQLQNSYKGMQALAGSLTFTPSVTSSQCGLYSGNSAFGDFFKQISAVESTTPGITSKLISDRTVLAFQIDGPLLNAYVSLFQNPETMEMYFPGPENQEQKKQALEMARNYGKKFQELDLTEIGITVNAPPFGYTPDFGIILTTGTKNASGLLQNLRTLVQDELANLNPQLSQMVKIEDFETAGGTKMLKVDTGGAQQMYGAPISDYSVAFGMTPSFVEGLQSQLASDSYIMQRATEKEKVEEITHSQFVMFLSSVPALEIAKSMAPLFLQQVPAKEPLDMNDVEQAVELAKFSLFAGQRMYTPEEGMFCAMYQQSLL